MPKLEFDQSLLRRLEKADRLDAEQNPPPLVPPLRITTERVCHCISAWISACVARAPNEIAVVARVFFDPDREALAAALKDAERAEYGREPPTPEPPTDAPAVAATEPAAPEPVTEALNAPSYDYMKSLTREQLTLRGTEPMPWAERMALEAEINRRVREERNPPRVDAAELEARLRRELH